ncbi:TadE family type IV pilus minor pilin [Ornithinimicrobium flavum]|uniref:TadE family type IV pilus minor pilin n=1 Tax=Ornithinimicrobium flavum TaxID=1288636 RepID=UPI00106F8DD2|nr:TadE family type IV pilus minor pilin [Ornithinimicrobium flavum]
MVSAELALAVPSVLLVLAICLTALALGVDQVRVVDAARVGARAASRGEDPAVVEGLVRARAPHGAMVSVDVDHDRVVVTVSAPARVRWLPAVPGAQGSAQALWEPGAGP